MNEVQIKKGYELFQIITDFAEPLEIFREAFQNSFDEAATEIYCRVYEEKRVAGPKLIFDIWDNGTGLEKSKVNCFFDLANSTKIDQYKNQMKGKLGYKGHGSKIFFNSEKVIICSKTKNEYWGVSLEHPLMQIEDSETFVYSDFETPSGLGLNLPEDWVSGFFLRIVSHKHFKTQHTMFKINHQNLRDYTKWFTVFGTVRAISPDELPNRDVSLYLHGLNIEDFQKEFDTVSKIDPLPVFIKKVINDNDVLFEKIPLGHFFPEERSTDKQMKDYVDKIKSSRPYYDYYSKIIFKEKVNCENNLGFYLTLSVEGYETKRQYDILLTRRGKSRTQISHTDSERYGLWACKGGIPVQKVDDWIEGAKGTFSFVQGFVDCDEFSLTANRGSINNTDIEKIDIIKQKVNSIFNEKKIKTALNERAEFEKMEQQLASINDDEENLKTRFKNSFKCRRIEFPCEKSIKEPHKNRTGYSESETLVLLIQLMSIYPDLFPFKLCDYDTRKGIDFVVEKKGSPKYIELKGTLGRSINHPFRHIYKFICYDLNLVENDIVTDLEEFRANLKINRDDQFDSANADYKGKKYKSYKLDPVSATIESMEIIVLKEIIESIIGGKFI